MSRWKIIVPGIGGIATPHGAATSETLKVFLSVVIGPQVKDHVRQEGLVRSSGLDWTLVRPVVLHDDATDAPAKVDLEDGVESLKLSRNQLARVLAEAVGREDWHGQTLSVSG